VKINKITSDMSKTTNWLGGKTTELFIYPQNTDYVKRNFEIRLSTATIDIEESDFTKLPGIHRILMVSEGNISLHFNENDMVKLQSWEFAEFEGDWNTKSKGKGKDINLMISDLWNANMNYIPLSNSSVDFNQTEDMKIIYCVTGETTINFENEAFYLQQGELLHIERESKNEKISFTIFSKNQADLIMCCLNKKQ
jgi:Uncharacterized protein conserved in bacteria